MQCVPHPVMMGDCRVRSDFKANQAEAGGWKNGGIFGGKEIWDHRQQPQPMNVPVLGPAFPLPASCMLHKAFECLGFLAIGYPNPNLPARATHDVDNSYSGSSSGGGWRTVRTNRRRKWSRDKCNNPHCTLRSPTLGKPFRRPG